MAVLVTVPSLGAYGVGSPDQLEPAAEVAFKDVPANHQFADAIKWLADQGITKGCNPSQGNTRFCPDEPVTRGQMAAFLVRAFALVDDGPTFVDTTNSVFAADISRLAEAGITKGCNPPQNTKFCPDEVVTRGQMAAFLTRAFELKPAKNTFTDDNGHIFEADIAALAAAGITKGCNPPKNDRYCPDEPVTRGQMAAFLHRAFGTPKQGHPGVNRLDPKTTSVYSGSDVSSVSITKDVTMVTFGPDQQIPAVGRLVVVRPGTNAPDGAHGRVVKVDGRRATLEPVPLDVLVPQADFEFEINLLDNRADLAAAGGQVRLCKNASSDSASGELEVIDGGVIWMGHWDMLDDPLGAYMNFQPWIKLRVRSELRGLGSLKCDLTKAALGRFAELKFDKTFPVAGIPLNVEIKPKVTFSVTGKVPDASFDQTFVVHTGLRVDRGKLTDLSRIMPGEFTWTETPEIEGSLELFGGINVFAGFKVGNDIAHARGGLEGSVGGFVALEGTPTAIQLKGGGRGSAKFVAGTELKTRFVTWSHSFVNHKIAEHDFCKPENCVLKQWDIRHQPKIATKELGEATVGVPYSFNLKTEKDSPKVTWQITSGPPWLKIDKNTGRLHGTPTSAGKWTVKVKATAEKGSRSAEATYELRAVAPDTVTKTAPAYPPYVFVDGYPVNYDLASLAASVGVPSPVNYTKGSGPWPGGLTLSKSGKLTGTVQVDPAKVPDTQLTQVEVRVESANGTHYLVKIPVLVFPNGGWPKIFVFPEANKVVGYVPRDGGDFTLFRTDETFDTFEEVLAYGYALGDNSVSCAVGVKKQAAWGPGWCSVEMPMVEGAKYSPIAVAGLTDDGAPVLEAGYWLHNNELIYVHGP